MKLSTGLLLLVHVPTLGCVTESAYKQEVKKADDANAQAAAAEKKAEQLNAQKQAADKLNAQLESEVKTNQVQIQKLEDQLKVTVLNQILFAEGGWEINRAGEQTLDKMVPALKSLQGQQIDVQGYTDDVPIGPELKSRFPSNWELSTARATDVVRYLASKGVDKNLMSATGFGDTHPIASNSTAEGRQKNRRIEIVVKATGQ
ncbi:MAG: OmpA/MotB family protein [Myxococcaceae bacterium]